VEYAVNMEVYTSIQPASLPGSMVKNNSDSLRSSRTVGSEEQQDELLSLKEMERMAITEALQRVQKRKGRKEDAAELLGISRASLFRKMKEYGLSK